MEFSVYFFAADDRHEAGERYRFVLDVARFIDSRGFRAIWTPERHFQEFGGSFPNPSVLAAAIAAVTERVELRAGSVVVPHHHPVRIVEEWSLVDQLSGGRVGLCLATGWHSGDFVFQPEHFADRREYTLATVDTLRALWRGESLSFPGPDGGTLPVRTFPRPRQPELPLWMVHTANPATWLEAGRRDLNVLTLLDSWERLAENVGAYRRARAEAGLDPAAGVVTVGMHTYVGEDEERVWRLVREPVGRYLSSFLTQKRGDRAAAAMSDEEQAQLAALVARDYYDRRSLLGTPAKCTAVLDRLAAIGVDEVACLVDFGLPFEEVLAGLPALDALRHGYAGPAGTAPQSAQSAQSPPARRLLAGYYDQ
ncbi:MupA/Atu3671 family FMN-dependent luciferase-like monooxygenase [Kitasatospora sp. NPDC056327]|uniref:MupA/Atu3671 family FMN-dependent luciferase-like monooxygenase n=1 Tax=Kitasatospora sp. NPDC056327 TaxID=3345785 RepID=UPI0035D57EC2